MEASLFSVKDETVNKDYPKFDIILIIFEFLVELIIQNGEENKSSF